MLRCLLLDPIINYKAVKYVPGWMGVKAVIEIAYVVFVNSLTKTKKMLPC